MISRRIPAPGLWMLAGLALPVAMGSLSGCGSPAPTSAETASDSAQFFLVVRTGGVAPSGSFAECVQRAVENGGSMASALEACRERAADVLGRGAVLIGDLQGMDATGARGARCEALIAEPRKVTEPRLSREDRLAIRAARLERALEAKRKAEQARAALESARERVEKSPNPGPERDARVRALDQATANYINAWYEVDFRAEQIKEDAIPRVPAPIDKERDEFLRMVDGCLETVSFIEECNGEGWQSRDCQFFVGGLRDCLDPAMVRGGRTCRHPAVSQRPQSVAVIACAEADPSACRRLPVEGKLYRYFVQPYEGTPPIACDDLEATIDADLACVQVYSVVQFPVAELQRALRAAKGSGRGILWFVPLADRPQRRR